jgi:hypothetical protein
MHDSISNHILTEGIRNKISVCVLGSVLLLEFPSGVLRTNIGWALLMDIFS